MSRIAGFSLIILALLLGAAGAAVAFLGAAVFTSRIPLLIVAGLGACLGISWALGWVAGTLLHRAGRGRVAIGVGFGTTLLVVLLSSITAFKPLVPASEITPTVVPPEIDFWQLPTGSRIAFRRIGAGATTEKPPMIYVHGGPGAGVAAVEVLVRAFSFPTRLGHDVFFYDQIGGGHSGRLADVSQYTVERHISDLEAIRRSIGAETVLLVGESWGAELATRYLAAHPERVERLVLVSPGPLSPQEWGDQDPCDLIGRAPIGVQEQFEHLIGPRLLAAALLLEVNPVAAHAFLPDAEGDSAMGRILAQLLPGGVCDPANLPAGEDFMFGMWGNLMTDEDWDRQDTEVEGPLSRLDTPVLIVRGECDYCIPEVASQYESVFTNSTLLHVEDAGHFVWLEKPEVLAKVVSSFLAPEPGPDRH